MHSHVVTEEHPEQSESNTLKFPFCLAVKQLLLGVFNQINSGVLSGVSKYSVKHGCKSINDPTSVATV